MPILPMKATSLYRLVMLISRHYAESSIYQSAHAFEQMGDWKTM